jgi:hypothetical protein
MWPAPGEPDGAFGRCGCLLSAKPTAWLVKARPITLVWALRPQSNGLSSARCAAAICRWIVSDGRRQTAQSRRYLCRTCESRYRVARENGYVRHGLVPPVKSECCDLCGLKRELLADHCHRTAHVPWLALRALQPTRRVRRVGPGTEGTGLPSDGTERSERLMAIQPPRKRVPMGQAGAVGRPRSRTPELIAAIASAADVDGVLSTLSEAGVARRTHQTWRTLGRKGVDPYHRFVAALALHGLDGRYAF